MNKVPKTRLCWNCEGSVSLAEETCPFCGVSVVPASLDGSNTTFAPPYTPQEQHSHDIPRSPYSPEEPARHKDLAAEEAEPALDEFKSTLQAVTLLLSGSVFFIFGLALVLFSNQGTFTLHWDGTIWYVYTLLSLPLLFLGWRALLKLE